MPTGKGCSFTALTTARPPTSVVTSENGRYRSNGFATFYDEIGWRQDGEGLYQNARYEDLRPVSRDYIHKCHLRVNRHIASTGDLLLDAGSGPVQWPEYLTYSAGYRFQGVRGHFDDGTQGCPLCGWGAGAVCSGGYRPPPVSSQMPSTR